MGHSIFGWSLPPGCHTLPGEEPKPPLLRCSTCGAFLSHKPELVEPWEDAQECDGKVVDYDFGPISMCGDDKPHAPHKMVWMAGHTEYRTCKRCGEVTS